MSREQREALDAQLREAPLDLGGEVAEQRVLIEEMMASTPLVDDVTVRLLGRVAYALSGLLDKRMQQSQERVLEAAGSLTPGELSRLPLLHLSDAPTG